MNWQVWKRTGAPKLRALGASSAGSSTLQEEGRPCARRSASSIPTAASPSAPPSTPPYPPHRSEPGSAGIGAARAPLRRPDGPRIECVTLADGPPGVQSQHDVDRAALSVQRFAQEHLGDAAGFVTACFSDPGLHMLREMKGPLSFGISECAALTALPPGTRLGVIAILQGSIGRHWRTWGAMGIAQRVAGEVAIGRTVTELSDQATTLASMIDAGWPPRDQHRDNPPL